MNHCESRNDFVRRDPNGLEDRTLLKSVVEHQSEVPLGLRRKYSQHPVKLGLSGLLAGLDA